MNENEVKNPPQEAAGVFRSNNLRTCAACGRGESEYDWPIVWGFGWKQTGSLLGSKCRGRFMQVINFDTTSGEDEGLVITCPHCGCQVFERLNIGS